MDTDKIPNKKGFSVVELLLAVIIIGVVSAVILPRFTNSSVKTIAVKNGQIAEGNNIQFKTAWRALYQKLSETYKMIQLNNGGTFSGLCSDNKCIMDQFLQHLNVASYCNDIKTGNCWHKSGEWYYLNGNKVSGELSSAGIILYDGSLILFSNAKSDCSGSICGYIYVDINGHVTPNTIGKDIFLISIYENSINPYTSQDPYDCDETSTNTKATGFGCSSKYLYN